MRCHKVQRLLPDYIGDELSFKNRGQIEQHLEQCPACRAELAALQAVWDSLVKQTLPQREEEFWQGFTARVMRDVKKKRPVAHKRPLLFPGWRVLLPAAGAAAAVIAAVIVLRGGQGPGQGPGEHGTIAEVAQPFSVAPLAGEDEGLLGQVIGLNGGNGSTEGKGIALKPAEKAALAEAMTQLDGDDDLSGQLDTLNERELERFDRLLSTRYSLSS
jgi:anti-sigma factor RsiW